jgi:hypothetical protein
MCTRNTCKGFSSSNITSRLQRRLVANVSSNHASVNAADDDANSIDCWRISVNKSSVCQSDALQCTTGAIGPLCGGCDFGYYFTSMKKLCESCTNVYKTVAELAVLFFIAIVLGTNSNRLVRIPEGMRCAWITGVFQRFDSGTLRVVWSNYQVSDLFMKVSLRTPCSIFFSCRS